MEVSEKEKIVNEVIETVLLRLPDVIGGIMKNHAELNKLTKEFYEKNPEFKKDPVSVKAVIGQLERENSDMTYNEILVKAAPLIRDRMKISSELNFDSVKEAPELDRRVNFEDHGEI